MSLCRVGALCLDIHFNFYHTCLFLNVYDSFKNNLCAPLNEVVMVVKETHLSVGGRECNRCLETNVPPET